MSMTDPIADMLARIRNAQGAEHDTVDMPLSKIKLEIARILKAEGYIQDYSTLTGENGHPALRVRLKYGHGRARTISGIKRISKPGGRVHARRDQLPKVLGGMGIAIVSTSSGIMTDREAKRAGVGGEVLAFVW
ncbi:MAG TPA: 30S ribosomal protein S8 [Actinomycetota bacterium]|nr:30S ribosomal protein S8 [Actinomycetota bacterium]